MEADEATFAKRDIIKVLELKILVQNNVGPAYAGALALMSSFRAYSGFWIVLGTLFNVKFWGQNS